MVSVIVLCARAIERRVVFPTAQTNWHKFI
jgi:hypothetical protein